MILSVKKDWTEKEILFEYEKKINQIKQLNANHRFVRSLDRFEVHIMMEKIHRVKKKESIQMTRQLIETLLERKIVTAQELYDDFGWSDKPVMKRLNTFIHFALVHRVAKKYYIATPRLEEFARKYMNMYLNA